MRTPGWIFKLLLLGFMVVSGSLPVRGLDQTEGMWVSSLESRVNKLEHNYGNLESGSIAFLAGAVCAWWAQNTKRNAWLWFFLGLIFNVITLLFLLYKNSQDLKRARAPGLVAQGRRI